MAGSVGTESIGFARYNVSSGVVVGVVSLISGPRVVKGSLEESVDVNLLPGE